MSIEILSNVNRNVIKLIPIIQKKLYNFEFFANWNNNNNVVAKITQPYLLLAVRYSSVSAIMRELLSGYYPKEILNTIIFIYSRNIYRKVHNFEKVNEPDDDNIISATFCALS